MAKHDGHFTLMVNGYRLRGWKRDGLWYFDCPHWPELAQEYAGSASAEAITTEFMAKVLQPAMQVIKRQVRKGR